MKKKILFISATHGNEGFTIPILEELAAGKYANKFDWIIGNPKALRENKRFIDDDLNRVAPGDRKSVGYESKIAYQLQKKFELYKYVIDLHGTPAQTGIFTIITNPKIENLYLAANLPIKNMVIWAPENLSQIGPLTQFVRCGLEIECGPKQSKRIQRELYKCLEILLSKEIKPSSQALKRKDVYKVYGSLNQAEYIADQKKLKEFTEVEINGDRFYPLLINRYGNNACYKMRKLNINLLNL